MMAGSHAHVRAGIYYGEFITCNNAIYDITISYSALCNNNVYSDC